MSGNNLHRDEAGHRAALIEVASTIVDVDFSGDSDTTFRSVTELHFTCREPGGSTFVNLTAPDVVALVLNGEVLDAATVFDGNRIALPSLAAENTLRVVADCAYMRTGEGLHRFVDPVDGEVYLYTQFETFDAHRAFACFDQPDLKSCFTFTVTGPAHWQVVSNMPSTESVEVRPGVRRWAFAESPRISSYITAIVAGPYHHVHDTHRGAAGDIPLGLYCRTSLAQHLDADELFRITKQGFTFFERTFGYPYPFGKYDQLFVPEFNAGAMENAGCVTILEDYVFRARETRASYERRAETVLHEMAHMWFGDLVTMRWWDDLWLNESFASFMAVLAQAEATSYTGAWATFCNVEKTWAYRQDQLPSTHPIAADIVDNEAVKVNFDGITYAKGASVLKQLVAWVGREEFTAALRGYFRRHEWASTSLGDLLSALEESSGRDLTAWSAEWLETAGVNTLRPRFEVDAADGTFTSFSILQEAPAEHPTLRSHRLAVGLYDRDGDRLVGRDRLELDVVGAVTDVPKLVGVRRPDLLLINDDDLAYAKIRLDDRSLATLREAIGGLPHPLARALCWAAAWDMTRDAELPARDYVSLVLRGVGSETDVGLVQTLLRQARLAIDNYLDPERRPAALLQMAIRARDGVMTAEPASDLQLIWARTFASAARSEEHVELLRELLSGAREIPGLQVDSELRWTLLTRLAALGAVGEAQIEAEAARDNTSAGARHAAAARAARPDPAAKESAWCSVIDSDALHNALLAATVGGFSQPDQQDLLEPYIDRYFDVVGRIWAERTLDMAHGLAVGFYPSYAVSEETVARTDAYLHSENPPPALRRVLLEGRAGIVRALAARERDRRAA